MMKLQFNANKWYIPLMTGALMCAVSLSVSGNGQSPASPVGLFEGNLILNNGEELEPIAMHFDTTGGMRLISELETIEYESPGIGVWKHSTRGEFEFGYISYRQGSNRLCTGFEPSDTAEACTLVVTGDYAIDTNGALTGELIITVKQRSDGGDDYTIPPLPFEAQKVTIEDLKSMHL